jgi:hypothetical protein
MNKPNYEIRINDLFLPTSILFYLIIIGIVGVNFAISGILFTLFNILSIVVFSLHLIIVSNYSNSKIKGIAPLNIVNPKLNDYLLEKKNSIIPNKNLIFWSVDENIRQEISTFGMFKNIHIVIPSNYQDIFNSKPDEFLSVINHEFTHIKNGDTWKFLAVEALLITDVFSFLFSLSYYLFQIYWFLADRTGFEKLYLPYDIFTTNIADKLFPESGTPSWQELILHNRFSFLLLELNGLSIGLGSFALSLVILFIFVRMMLRYQEFYADAFSSSDMNSRVYKNALIRIGIRIGIINANLKKNVPPRTVKTKFNITHIKNTIKFHPSIKERFELINDTRKISKYSNALAFLGGLLIGYLNWKLGIEKLSLIGLTPSHLFLPIIGGIILLSTNNIVVLICFWESPQKILRNIISGTFSYMLSFLISHYFYACIAFLEVRNSNVFFGPITYEGTVLYDFFIQNFSIYLFYIPIMLFTGCTVSASALLRMLKNSQFTRKELFWVWGVLLMLISFSIWYGLNNPAITIIQNGFLQFRPTTINYIAWVMIFLLSLFLLKSKYSTVCKKCGTRSEMRQPKCNQCGELLIEWPFTYY